MRLSGTFLAMFAILGIGVVTAPVEAQERWIAYSYVADPERGEADLVRQLGEAVAVATGGDVAVEPKLAGTLDVAPADILAAVEDGEVHLALHGLYVDDLPAGRIPHLPMLATGQEAFDTAMSVVGPVLAASLAERGVELLAYVRYPAEVLWSATPITAPGDLAGRNVRVTTPDQGELVRVLGGTPVTIAAPDVRAALDAETVDTVFTSASVIAEDWGDRLTRGYRLAPTRFSALVIANRAAFDALAPDVQASIRETAEQLASALTAQLAAEETAAYERLAEGGLVVDAPSAEQAQSVADDMIAVWSDWATAQGGSLPELLSRVRTAIAGP